MKHETSNLLIGLGIGAVVGVAIGYLMVADNRRNWQKNSIMPSLKSRKR